MPLPPTTQLPPSTDGPFQRIDRLQPLCVRVELLRVLGADLALRSEGVGERAEVADVAVAELLHVDDPLRGVGADFEALGDVVGGAGELLDHDRTGGRDRRVAGATVARRDQETARAAAATERR